MSSKLVVLITIDDLKLIYLFQYNINIIYKRSGTWMMTGNGVMHNGTTVMEQYGQNLDRLQVGDRVGVVRKDDGTLHFWVNGIDQGPAATKVPERIYGVIGEETLLIIIISLNSNTYINIC